MSSDAVVAIVDPDGKLRPRLYLQRPAEGSAPFAEQWEDIRGMHALAPCTYAGDPIPFESEQSAMQSAEYAAPFLGCPVRIVRR